MSLDKILLTEFLYTSFFKNNLVDFSKEKKNKKVNATKAIEFLGGNKQQILVLAKDSENKFIGDDQMKFLNDLLNACNLTMADIAFINIYERPTLSYEEIKKQMVPKKILLFGVTSKELNLPFEIPFFQVQNFYEEAFVICPSLQEIQVNKELKKQLWNSLQKIFNIRK